MDFFIQQVVNGLTLGSMYALVALGFSLVFGVLGVLNFAHGELLMVAAFIGYFVMLALGGPDGLVVPASVAILAMFAAAIAGVGALAVVVERIAFRPIRDAPRMVPLLSALGVAFALQSLVLLFFGARFRSYDTSEFVPFSTRIDVGPLEVWAVRLLVIVGAAAVMLLLWVLVKRTRLGKAMRAIAADREAAAMMGIDIDRVIRMTFFVSGILAAVAGVMMGLVFSRVYHLMGFYATLTGFTAAIVGGIGSIPGAVLGGLAIGFTEAFAGAYISSRFQDLIVFGVLILVVLLRPTGLLGSAELKKV